MKTQFMAMALAAALLSPASAFATVYSSPIKVNGGLLSGDVMTSPNGKYALTLQASDGNLVVFRNEGMKAVWASDGFGGTVAMVQPDGNFVVYNTNLSPPPPVWYSNTGARPFSNDVVLWLRDDGSLALTYDASEVWTSPPDAACPNGEETYEYQVCITEWNRHYTKIVPACSVQDALAIAGQAHDVIDVSANACRPGPIPE